MTTVQKPQNGPGITANRDVKIPEQMPNDEIAHCRYWCHVNGKVENQIDCDKRPGEHFRVGKGMVGEEMHAEALEEETQAYHDEAAARAATHTAEGFAHVI